MQPASEPPAARPAPLPAQPDIPAAAWEAAALLPDVPGPTDLQRLRARNPTLATEHWTFVVNQTLLRRRATTKLGPEAARMLLTADGLEQASRPAVAVRRFRDLHRQGWRSVLDLGCGIGVDAAAAAREGLAVVAVEQDGTAAMSAAHNLAALAPHAPARVVRADACEWVALQQDGGAVVYLDPGRRRGHHRDGTTRRVGDPAQWQPPWPWIEAFARDHPATVVKVAPGIDRDLVGRDVADEWLSVGGNLVEADLWFPAVRNGRPARSAVLLTPTADPWTPGPSRTLHGDGEPAPVAPLGAWLLEPDPAVIRSGLVGDLAVRVGAGSTSDGIAYLTGDGPVPAGWGRVSRILDVLPARTKLLRARLRGLGLRPTEIRTRGLNLDPQRLRGELPGSGAPAALVMTRVAGEPVALLVDDEPVPGA